MTVVHGKPEPVPASIFGCFRLCADEIETYQVDKANAEVQRLEAENAEIRAEMEAAKLSAAESTRTQQEAAKREKRVRKKSQTRDRQRQQLQDEIEETRCMQAQLQKEIDDTCKATKEAEVSSKFLVRCMSLLCCNELMTNFPAIPFLFFVLAKVQSLKFQYCHHYNHQAEAAGGFCRHYYNFLYTIIL